MIQVRIIVSGIVQGVNYRYNTREIARQLSLTGWVKNRSDGTVEILAQGEKDKIKDLIKWCEQGTLNSSIDKVKMIEEEMSTDSVRFNNFEIEY